jgi:pimeloyl-ACP methyl ester carboxylesterase
MAGLWIALAGSAGPAELAGQDRAVEGRWQGAILVLGSELGIGVQVVKDAEAWTATIDIPQQGAMGLPLRNVTVELPRVHFELMGGPGLAVFDGTLVGDSITGTFTQAGVEGTFHLGREDTVGETEATSTGDTVTAYREEEVTFANGDVTLAGTLTLPSTPGPYPAVVLITGSGPQDRDEQVFGMRPFRLIADHLARAGIAVLRYDDRGVGGSTGNVQLSTSEDFAADAIAGVALLRDRPDIRSDRVGLVGHSEGAIVAPIASVKSPDVAFLVLLAGTAVTGSEILLAQGELIARAGGASEEDVATQRRLQEMVFAAVRADTGWDALQAEIERQIRAGIDDLPEEQRAAITDLDSFVATRSQQQLVAVRTPWFRYFLDYDPKRDLRRVAVPVLGVFAEKDLQVPPSVNLEPMRAALDAAPTDDVTIEVISGANHLFQAATTGSPDEYASLPKEFVAGFMELVSGWIVRRTGGPGPDGTTAPGGAGGA